MSRLFSKLEALTHSENESERKLATQLLKMDASLADTSAIALGKLCGVSNASVVRFSQNLGYKGYTALKLDFLADRKSLPGYSPDTLLTSDVSTEKQLRKAAHLLMEPLDHSLQHLDIAQVERVAERIHTANNIAILGQGSASLAASYVAQRLSQSQRAVLYQQEGFIQQSYARQMDENDVILVLSTCGESEQIVTALSEAKKSGCFILCVTGDASSAISELADVSLLFSYREENLNALGSGPLISLLAIMDLLMHCTDISRRNIGSLQPAQRNQEWIDYLKR